MTLPKCPTCGGAVIEHPAPGEIEHEALELLLGDLEGCSSEVVRFFELVWSQEPVFRSAKALAAAMDVRTSSLLSRFIRAGLPSPKRYVEDAAFVRAARLFEDPRVSVLRAAYALESSSPQAFARSLRRSTGLSPGVFRALYTGTAALQRYRTLLVLPYRETLRHFKPITGL